MIIIEHRFSFLFFTVLGAYEVNMLEHMHVHRHTIQTHHTYTHTAIKTVKYLCPRWRSVNFPTAELGGNKKAMSTEHTQSFPVTLCMIDFNYACSFQLSLPSQKVGHRQYHPSHICKLQMCKFQYTIYVCISPGMKLTSTHVPSQMTLLKYKWIIVWSKDS